MIVYDERVARYIEKKCQTKFAQPFTVMGLERDGVIVAGVLFNNMASRDIEVTVAGECGAFTRGFLRAVGHYVFKQLHRNRISVTTRYSHVREIAERLGAKSEGIKRDYYGKGQHAILLGILREDWKFR